VRFADDTTENSFLDVVFVNLLKQGTVKFSVVIDQALFLPENLIKQIFPPEFLGLTFPLG